MFSVLLWYKFEVQHCAIRTVNLDAQVGWLSQFVPTPAMYIHHFCQQQCANYLPLVMGNTLRVNPIIPSTPSPFNTPQTAISKNNPDFSAFSFSRCVFHTSPPLPPAPFSFSYPILLFISSFLSILLLLSRETFRFVSWICMNRARAARSIIIYSLFIYLFIVYFRTLRELVIYVGANYGSLPWNRGYAVAQLVEVLRYKPEGRGFDSWWCHWNFLLA